MELLISIFIQFMFMKNFPYFLLKCISLLHINDANHMWTT